MNAIAINVETGNHQGVSELPAKMVGGGNPVSESWVSSEFAVEGKVRTGIWVGQPGKIKIKSYPTNEVFTVISGKIELINEDGTVVLVHPGESGLMRKGWKGVFHIVEETRKCFVTVGG
jgi:hypothetical protein